MTANPQSSPREHDLKVLIDAMTAALSGGDRAGLAQNWYVPALAISAERATPLRTADEVGRHCAETIERLRARGPGPVTARVETCELLGDDLLWIDVVWMPPDGDPTANLRQHYLARRDPEDGSFKLCIATDVHARAYEPDGLTAALKGTFPASDPVSMTDPTTSIGSPRNERAPRPVIGA